MILDFIVGASRTFRKPSRVCTTTAQSSGPVACAIPVARNSAATPVRMVVFNDIRPNVSLLECISVQLVAHAFEKQGSNFHCELADMRTRQCASTWHDIGNSHNWRRCKARDT